MSPQVKQKPKDLEKELEGKLSEIKVQKAKDEALGLSKRLGLPFINLVGYPMDVNALGLLDENEARAGRMVVISEVDRNLKIAVLNPENKTTKDVLKKLSDKGFKYSLAVTTPGDLESAIKRYAEIKKREKVQLGVIDIQESQLSEIKKQIADISDLKKRLSSMSVTKAVTVFMAGALKVQASDVHFENEENGIRMRYRVDGILTDIASFGREGYIQFLSRVKLMAGLKINVHNQSQDGRFTIKEEDADIEIRVSVIPSEYGEDIVMRILDPRTIKQDLKDLGMRKDTLEVVKRVLGKRTGAIITTGPTGAGKTTTLYAFLRHINGPEIKIITLEDPIEYHLEGITQTQAEKKGGYTFASGLQSIVRQDPDVIMVGEIRDKETAETAMQASLTGHLVFTTLHTNDAAGAIPRLIDLGVKPITIAPALNIAMAQRLARKLCPDCKTKKKLSSEETGMIKKYLPKNWGGVKKLDFPAIDQAEVYTAGQCKKCNQTGYRGRVGIFELFEVDDEMERLIQKSPSISDVKDLAVKKGMITLLQDGLIKALEGITSLEEIMRVVGE